MLTGRIKSPDDLDPNDMRRHFDRFLPENFHHNLKVRKIDNDLYITWEERKTEDGEILIKKLMATFLFGAVNRPIRIISWEEEVYTGPSGPGLAADAIRLDHPNPWLHSGWRSQRMSRKLKS